MKTTNRRKYNLQCAGPAEKASAQGATLAAQSTGHQALSDIKSEADTNKEISKRLSEEVKRFQNI